MENLRENFGNTELSLKEKHRETLSRLSNLKKELSQRGEIDLITNIEKLEGEMFIKFTRASGANVIGEENFKDNDLVKQIEEANVLISQIEKEKEEEGDLALPS